MVKYLDKMKKSNLIPKSGSLIFLSKNEIEFTKVHWMGFIKVQIRIRIRNPGFTISKQCYLNQEKDPALVLKLTFIQRYLMKNM